MIDERIAKFALRKSGNVAYRETGYGRALVFLHGIGSQSVSWLNQFETLTGYRLKGPGSFRKVVSGRKLWNYDKKELEAWKAAF